MGRKISEKSQRRIDLVLRYQDTGGLAAREELVEDMQPLVESLASSLESCFCGHVDHDEIVSDCYLGLLDAIDRYDIGKGTTFETYACIRMKGMVFDCARQRNPGTRQITRLEKKLDKIRETHPDFKFQSYEERRELTGMSKLAFYGGISASNLKNSCSLYEIVDSSENLRLCDVLANRKAEFLENLMLTEYIEILMNGIKNPSHREIFRLYFLERIQMRKVGEKVGFSESRVSQIIRDIRQLGKITPDLLEGVVQELESKIPEDGNIIRSYLLKRLAA